MGFAIVAAGSGVFAINPPFAPSVLVAITNELAPVVLRSVPVEFITIVLAVPNAVLPPAASSPIAIELDPN